MKSCKWIISSDESGSPGRFARRERLLRAGGLDIVDTNKADFIRRHIQAQRDIDIAGRQDAGRGANQLIPDVDFLIAVGSAGNLSGSDGCGKGRERIVRLALDA